MINKLKKTQTQHQLVLEDFDRINQNLVPSGPLSTLRESIGSGKKKSPVVAPKKVESFASPKTRETKPAQGNALNQSGSSGKGSKNYYKHHKLYDVSDYY